MVWVTMSASASSYPVSARQESGPELGGGGMNPELGRGLSGVQGLGGHGIWGGFLPALHEG